MEAQETRTYLHGEDVGIDDIRLRLWSKVVSRIIPPFKGVEVVMKARRREAIYYLARLLDSG